NGRILRRERWATIMGALLIAGVGCSSDPELSLDSVTTTSTTTAATEAATTGTDASTSSTLSERDQRIQELQTAEAEIEQVIEAWWTYPYDTSAGEEGLPLEYTVNPLHDRYVANAQADTEAGQIRRARGGNELRIIDSDLAFEEGTAEARLCVAGDWEVVDAETGAELGGSDGVPGEAVVYLQSIDAEWKISEFLLSRATGDNVACDL
ncbi:MAG: hypothetical protein ACR2QO_28880, partial [Acidimicrobiales bacterium]